MNLFRHWRLITQGFLHNWLSSKAAQAPLSWNRDSAATTNKHWPSSAAAGWGRRGFDCVSYVNTLLECHFHAQFNHLLPVLAGPWPVLGGWKMLSFIKRGFMDCMEVIFNCTMFHSWGILRVKVYDILQDHNRKENRHMVDHYSWYVQNQLGRPEWATAGSRCHRSEL